MTSLQIWVLTLLNRIPSAEWVATIGTGLPFIQQHQTRITFLLSVEMYLFREHFECKLHQQIDHHETLRLKVTVLPQYTLCTSSFDEVLPFFQSSK